MSFRSLEVLLSTATSTAVAAPATRRWLLRQGYFDHPNLRSSHTVPTPRGGGLACVAGAVVGSAVAAQSGRPPSFNWAAISGLLGAVGRVDDLRGLSVAPRLGMQVLAGAFAGSMSGGLPGAAFGVVAVPAIVNAFNFMDGINGITGGTAVAWGACIAGDSTLPSNLRTQGQITAGMGLGFLPSNVPSASMFLGDVGSYLIGAGVAVSVVESAFVRGRFSACGSMRTLAPLVPYLVDTGSTILQRALAGRSLTEPHREHAYQQLVDETGWDHWKVALVVAAAALGCGVAGRTQAAVGLSISISSLYLLAPAMSRFVEASRNNPI